MKANNSSRMQTCHVGVTHGWRHSIKHHLWHKHMADSCYVDRVLPKLWSWCWEFTHTHTYTHNTYTHVPTDCLKRKLNRKTINRKIPWFAHSEQIFPYYFTTRAPLDCQEMKQFICQPSSKFHSTIWDSCGPHTWGHFNISFNTGGLRTWTHTHTCANRLPEQEAKPQDTQLQNSMVCAFSANLPVLFHYTCSSGLSGNEAVRMSAHFQIPLNTVRQLQSTNIDTCIRPFQISFNIVRSTHTHTDTHTHTHTISNECHK